MFLSLVTPCYNSSKTIRKTLDSILAQTCTDYEYIVMDGGSTDGTVDILKEYEPKFAGRMRFISEPDKGVYDAVRKGFTMANGEVYAWLGSDDVYFPYTVRIVKQIFGDYPYINWITGENCHVSSSDVLMEAFFSKSLSYFDFARGKAFWVQQEATFWRSELWKKLDDPFGGYRLAGDYYLWAQFARNDTLHTVPVLLAAFRLSNTQLSFTHLDEYMNEVSEISRNELKNMHGKKRIYCHCLDLSGKSRFFKYCIMPFLPRPGWTNTVLVYSREKDKFVF